MTRSWLILCFLLPLSALALDPAMKAEILQRHGVRTDSPGLTAFLRDGWEAAREPENMPAEPALKTSLLVDAWDLLGRRFEAIHKGDARLVKAIANTAGAYMGGRFSPAVQRMMDEDARLIPAPNMMEWQEARRELLQYNGMVAFGLFAKPTLENQRQLKEIYRREKRPMVRVMMAQSLALLGDDTVLPDLIDEIAKANTDSSIVAARVLSNLTGRTFPLTARLAEEPRQIAAAEILDWWLNQRSAPLYLDREAAVERMLYEPPERPYPLRTLRELLRASADKTDTANKRGSRTAWTILNAKGKALLEPLELVLENEKEDLDIRMEAIRWYVRLTEEEESRRLKKWLKRLREDPNPSIAKMAREILESRDL